MTIKKQNGKYIATAQGKGWALTKAFTDLEKAKEWLRAQYGIVGLEIEVV